MILTISKLILEKPVLISASFIDSQLKEWKVTRTNFENVLICVQAGFAEILTKEKKYTVERGAIILNFHHHSEMQIVNMGPNFKAIAIICERFNFDSKIKASFTGEDNVNILYTDSNFQEFEAFFVNLHQEFIHKQIGYEEMTSSLVHSILIKLCRMMEIDDEAQSYSSAVQNVKAYIESNFHLELTLPELARLVYISPYHLAHLFKEEVGMAPIQYLIQCRITHAKRLLTETNLSVKDIAMKVGYPNANYFNLLFKKMTGLSPGKYSKKK